MYPLQLRRVEIFRDFNASLVSCPSCTTGQLYVSAENVRNEVQKEDSGELWVFEGGLFNVFRSSGRLWCRARSVSAAFAIGPAPSTRPNHPPLPSPRSLSIWSSLPSLCSACWPLLPHRRLFLSFGFFCARNPSLFVSRYLQDFFASLSNMLRVTVPSATVIPSSDQLFDDAVSDLMIESPPFAGVDALKSSGVDPLILKSPDSELAHIDKKGLLLDDKEPLETGDEQAKVEVKVKEPETAKLVDVKTGEDVVSAALAKLDNTPLPVKNQVTFRKAYMVLALLITLRIFNLGFLPNGAFSQSFPYLPLDYAAPHLTSVAVDVSDAPYIAQFQDNPITSPKALVRPAQRRQTRTEMLRAVCPPHKRLSPFLSTLSLTHPDLPLSSVSLHSLRADPPFLSPLSGVCVYVCAYTHTLSLSLHQGRRWT